MVCRVDGRHESQGQETREVVRGQGGDQAAGNEGSPQSDVPQHC